jgi:hypothetical protein
MQSTTYFGTFPFLSKAFWYVKGTYFGTFPFLSVAY